MKKKVPLQVLETLEPYIDKSGTHYIVVDPGDFLLKLKDIDENSPFYFNVEQYKTEREFVLFIDFKPKDKQSVANSRIWIKGIQLNDYFSNWVKILEGYEKVKSVYDDPIIEAFRDEYFAEFDIIDEDADTSPFTTKQILLLDKHLSNIEKKIEKHSNDKNKDLIIEIKEDAKELRKNLTNQPKKWVIKNLSNLWAKMTKAGINILKEFLTEGKRYAIREAIKFISEKGNDLIG